MNTGGLTPTFCPHCLADFVRDQVEIKTSNPPKCGRCLLPLWWEDRGGVKSDRPWPSYPALTRAAEFRAALYKLLVEGVGPGGGFYREDQRLPAAVALLEVGWGKV